MGVLHSELPDLDSHHAFASKPNSAFLRLAGPFVLHALARHRRVRGVTPTRLPESRTRTSSIPLPHPYGNLSLRRGLASWLAIQAKQCSVIDPCERLIHPSPQNPLIKFPRLDLREQYGPRQNLRLNSSCRARFAATVRARAPAWSRMIRS